MLLASLMVIIYNSRPSELNDSLSDDSDEYEPI